MASENWRRMNCRRLGDPSLWPKLPATTAVINVADRKGNTVGQLLKVPVCCLFLSLPNHGGPQ